MVVEAVQKLGMGKSKSKSALYDPFETNRELNGGVTVASLLHGAMCKPGVFQRLVSAGLRPRVASASATVTAEESTEESQGEADTIENVIRLLADYVRLEVRPLWKHHLWPVVPPFHVIRGSVGSEVWFSIQIQ